MPSRSLPGIGLNGFWDLGEAWKTGGDQNWLKLSVLTQLFVESATAALPSSPSNGYVAIVPTGSADAGKVAVRDSGTWVYYSVPVGTQAWVADLGKRLEFVGGTWRDVATTSNFATVVPVTATSKTLSIADSGQYLRFTATGAKTLTLDPAAGFSANQEFHLANRATSGTLTLTALSGITLRAPKNGTLNLQPGDTATIKFVSSSEADLFGSTEVSP